MAMYASSSQSGDESKNSGRRSEWDIDPIHSVPQKPSLSPKICLEDSKGLQAFLKLSRYGVDDNLRSNLNNVLGRNEDAGNSIFKYLRSAGTKESQCKDLLAQFIYPEWKKRVDVIQYCQGEMVKMSTEDQMDDGGFTALSAEEKNNLLRIDPYTYKNLEQKYLQRNARIIELQTLYDNEEQVENIIRNRSVDLLGDVCKLRSAAIKQGFLDYARSMADNTNSRRDLSSTSLSNRVNR